MTEKTRKALESFLAKEMPFYEFYELFYDLLGEEEEDSSSDAMTIFVCLCEYDRGDRTEDEMRATFREILDGPPTPKILH